MENTLEICKKIRRDIIETSYKAGACHLGSALSCVEILVTLYYSILKKEDYFLFSKASGVATLYSILADKGYFPKEKLVDYLKYHPLPSKEVPGVIHSLGSLGMGLSVACGLALSDRTKRVYCLISDGELDEGNTWEALLFAGHHRLTNLVAICDNNRIQACGLKQDILNVEPLYDKFKAFNWHPVEIDGHNLEGLKLLLEQRWQQPTMVIANTTKGKGVSFMEGRVEWHYKNLDESLFQRALKENGR